MHLRVLRNKDGRVVATADLATDDGLVPEFVLDDGQTEDVVEVKRLDLIEDVDRALARLPKPVKR